MSNAAFVLMNCDLVAVPLQAGGAGLITIYCGARRAAELRDERRSHGAVGRKLNLLRGASATLPGSRIAPHEAARVGHR